MLFVYSPYTHKRKPIMNGLFNIYIYQNNPFIMDYIELGQLVGHSLLSLFFSFDPTSFNFLTIRTPNQFAVFINLNPFTTINTLNVFCLSHFNIFLPIIRFRSFSIFYYNTDF